MASHLLKTNFTASTSNTYTVSFWLKFCDTLHANLGSTNVPYFWSIGHSGEQTSGLFFQGDNTDKNIAFYNGSDGNRYPPASGSYKIKDCAAWYHVHFKVSNGTGILYLNGVEIKNSISVPAQNSGSSGQTHCIHGYANDPSGYNDLDCLYTHFHFVDGTAYAPTVFASEDSVTGEWQINTSPSVNYGTNGYFILKDGNSGTDHSGNNNDFTASGSITKTSDNPSNNFATLNPNFLANGYAATMSNGNTTSYVSSNGIAGVSTLGASSGKYYAEFKHSACTSGGSSEGAVGVCDTYFMSMNQGLGGSSSPGYQEYSLGNWGLRGTNGRIFYSSSGSKYTADNNHAGWSLGDIIMLGLDCDNNRLYFGKNGQWSSSNTWSSSTPSQYITIDPTNFEGTYHFACGDSSGTNVSTWQCNFGNGFFSTTEITTNTGTGFQDEDGNGRFYYNPPTNYRCLSTKGLNQ